MGGAVGDRVAERHRERMRRRPTSEAARLFFSVVDLATVSHAPFTWDVLVRNGGVVGRDGPAIVTGPTAPLNRQRVADHGRFGARLTSYAAERTAIRNLESHPIRHGAAILAQPLRHNLL